MKQKFGLIKAAEMMQPWKESGQCVTRYCESEGINKATFYYWRQRISEAEHSESPKFLPVRIEKLSPKYPISNNNLELTYPNGVRLLLSDNSDLNLIRQLIQFA
jgi:hypothetical protein